MVPSELIIRVVILCFISTYLPLFAPKAPRVIKGAHNKTLIRLTHWTCLDRDPFETLV